MDLPAQLIGVAYTGDIDQSVAKCDPIPGFGCFEIPISGPMTALVGRNGSGKTRFLKSIGVESELVYKMAPPLEQAVAFDSRGRRESWPLLPTPLWGLADGGDEDDWCVPNPWNQSCVDGIWPEAPRSRARTLSEFNKADRDWTEFLHPGEALTQPTDDRYHFPTVRGQRFAEHLWQRAIASQQQPAWLEELAPFAATAMYTAWSGEGMSAPTAAEWQWREKLFMLSVGREIAHQCLISLTGTADSDTQRLRFWFDADALNTPAVTLLLIGHERSASNRYRSDLGETIRGPDDDRDPTNSQPLFIRENFGYVVYATWDAGLLTHPGSSRHFTPLLPLRLNSAAAVLHADDKHPLFLDGYPILAPPNQPAPHAWFRPDEPSNWVASNLDYTRGEGDDMEFDGAQIDLTAGLTRRKRAAEAAWRESLLLGRGDLTPWDMTVSNEEQQFLDVLVRVANRVSHLLLEDPPTACIDISTGRVEWRFVKHGPVPNSRHDTLGLDDLSLAERRWTTFAILLTSRFFGCAITAFGEPHDREWAAEALATTRMADPFGHTPTVITIDEPESGLHPTAIRHLSQGLEQLGGALPVHFAVATHSPHVLRTVRGASGTIAHAHLNDSGETIFEAVDPTDIDSLAAFIGMHQEDVLLMTSTFVIVEGEHDKVVLEEVLRDSLAQAGAAIVPMRGADNSHQIVDSAILWRFHEGRVIVVLDSLNTARITTSLAEAQALIREGARDEALAVIDSLKTGSADEGTRELEALHELLIHATLSDRLQRLEVFSLSKPDIIDYFHPSELGATPEDVEFVNRTLEEIWPELLKRYRNAPKKNKPGFKTWALLQLGIAGDVTSVLSNAARGLDRIPSDFEDLRQLLLSRR